LKVTSIGLDYWSGCVNFRDVGESPELIADGIIFPIGRLYRGGKIDFVSDFEKITTPATILNLRRGEDLGIFRQLTPTFLHPMAWKSTIRYEQSECSTVTTAWSQSFANTPSHACQETRGNP